MAFPTPSVGDIMMLSQLSWKIECAFRSGRAGAPAEFQKVEIELRRLTKSITSFAQAFDDDDCLLERANQDTKDVLASILGFCHQVLDDLESLICQYQEIKRTSDSGWFVGKRSWKQILVRNYRTIWWTSEGGDIRSLIDILSIHSQSVRLMKQALRSKSPWHFAETVDSCSEILGVANHKPQSNIDVKIVELHNMVNSMDSTEYSPLTQPVPKVPALNVRASRIVLPRVDTQPAPTRSLYIPSTPQEVPELSWSEAASPASARGSADSAALATIRCDPRPISESQRATIDYPPRFERPRRAPHMKHRNSLSYPPFSAKRLRKSPPLSRSPPPPLSDPPSVPLPPIPAMPSIAPAPTPSSNVAVSNRPPTPPAKDYRLISPPATRTAAQQHQAFLDASSLYDHSETLPPSLQNGTKKENSSSKWWRRTHARLD